MAAPGAIGEDDGVVLSVVLDGRRGNSFLLVLDALHRALNETGWKCPAGIEAAQDIYMSKVGAEPN